MTWNRLAMLNRYPLWKYILIIFVVVFGFLYALPNLYPDDPAIQISGVDSSVQLDTFVDQRIKKVLENAKIDIKSIEVNKKSHLVRLKRSDQQQLARSLIKTELGENYVVALNLALTTPKWLTNIGAYPMKLGLDLSGGVHFLLHVDTPRVIKQRLDTVNNEIRANLRKKKLRYKTLPDNVNGFKQLGFSTENSRNEARSMIKRDQADLQIDSKEVGDQYVVIYGFSPNQINKIEDEAIKQNLTSMRNRVNELGVSEPLVQRQGRQNIVVELPGIQDTAEAKRILGKTANLEFRLQGLPKESSSKVQSFPFSSMQGDVLLERNVILTGDRVSGATSSFDVRSGLPIVNVHLDSMGGARMYKATNPNVGRKMAVLFIEQKPVMRIEKKVVDGALVENKVSSFREEKRIISLATIESSLSTSFTISGLNSPAEASELALLLRAGSLAAPMFFVEERTVGPSLGAENIKMGIDSTIVGLLLVVVFMVVVYRVFGFMANVALTINLVLLIAFMSLLGATLTMPGIAGIVLTLGMAVDANVLVFSRIREEIKNGRSIQKAIDDGYDRAFVSIFDGNITTLLVGVILFAVGTGPIKGFAVTLSIGILTSMFTAIMVTRCFVNLYYGGRRNLKKLSI